MTARAFLLVLAASGCTAESSPTEGTHLPSDAYFTEVLSPYATLDACMADYPDVHQCAFELALCHSGFVGEQRANTVYEGEYHLDGQRAVVVLDGVAFDLDVETGTVDPYDVAIEARIPDADRLWQTPAFGLLHCP